ncbi:hypothetical protein NCCP1664_26620 [Zafaria cholistanensis]|uniref:Transporter n=1 Tax=Zafaria cholistanensis TaxID=1682741 RepID=A0A5A7NVG5_9MICC|nr:transporter [Zafaria cholistanensis]GER24167.1 hypothetical protein NCCP1664_26620 [Zafaria cholistanensis]
MVAHLLRLKAILLRNGFRRSPWQLVGVAAAGLYGLFLVALLFMGLFYLGGTDPGFAAAVLVPAVSAAVLGWALLPVLATGVDLTLDPARFTTFTVRPWELVAGLLLSGFIGVPGLVTLFLFAGQALAWRQVPAAAAVAVPCGVLAAVLCLALARLTTTAASALTASRRFRDAAAVLLIVPLLGLGPVLTVVVAGFEDALGWLPRAAAVLGWTPLGSFAAVPADVAAGSWGTAAVRLALSLAYLAAVVGLWKRTLERALETPREGPRGGRTASGLGAFARFPATPWGAVAARCLAYWRRDPRYAVAILAVPLVPAMMWVVAVQAGSTALMLWTGPIVAVLLAFSISADVSYDSTAFALHATSGIRGVHDRLGRVAACAVFALPAVLAAAVLPPVLLGEARLLPGVAGLSLGALASGFGVASVASARFTYAVPPPGESPFKNPPGAGMRMVVVQLATMWVMGLLLLPPLALLVAHLVTGNAAFGWAGLVAGPALGAVLLVAGVRLGGRWFDARVPELMQATVLNR